MPPNIRCACIHGRPAHWPVRRKLATPKPPAPSSRVVLAFCVAAVIGAAVFAIWWTSERYAGHGNTGSELPQDKPAASSTGPAPAAASAPAIAADPNNVPRGSVLRGPIDPDHTAETIAALTQATLVRVNRSTDQIEPWLAESWTPANNSLTYVLKLRPNILWSDGTPLSAADVVQAIGASSSARVFGKPLTARAKSATEVEVTLPGAFAPGLRVLDRVPITSAHGGLGPFVPSMKRRVFGETRPALLMFERNPHYWRTAPDGKPLPYLDRLELDAAGDPNAALTRLLGGELDFIETELRPEDYTALKRADEEDKTRLYDMGPGLTTDDVCG